MKHPPTIPTDSLRIVSEGIRDRWTDGALDGILVEMTLSRHGAKFPDTTTVYVDRRGEDIDLFVCHRPHVVDSSLEHLPSSIDQHGYLVCSIPAAIPVQVVLNGEQSFGKWTHSRAINE